MEPRLAGWEKDTEIGTAARNPTKGGIKSEQQQDGEGRGGIPAGWEPGLGAAGTARNGAGQTGRNAVGQAASLPQQALPVPQRLRHKARRGAAPSLLGNSGPARAAPLQAPLPAPPGTTAVRRSPLQPGWLGRAPLAPAPGHGEGDAWGLLPVWSQLSVGFALHRVLLVHPRAVEVPVQGTAAVLAQRLHAEAVGVQALRPPGAPRQTVTS